MKKKIAGLLAFVMLFSLLAACGGDSDSGSSSEPIKVGHICDVTGTEALTGAQASAALEFAVQYVGEICGREIEVITLDSQSSASGAADAATQLIEDYDVDVIVGPTLIGHKMAVAAIAQANEVPVIFYNPTPVVEDIMNNEWVIGAAGSNPQMPTVIADYIYNVLGYTKVYTLSKDDSGGTSYIDPFTENFEALGGTVIAQKWAPQETTDFSSYLQTMTDPEAEALVAWTSGSAAIALWQSWYELGLNETLPMVAVFHGAFTDSFICDALETTNPDLVEAMLGTVAPMTWAYDAGEEEIDSFVAAYQEANDGAIPIGNNLSGATVQVMLLLKAAVESLDGDTSDSAALRDALLAADITGPEGRTVFENGSNMATKDIYVVQVAQLDDGEYNYSFLKKYENVPVEGLSVD